MRVNLEVVDSHRVRLIASPLLLPLLLPLLFDAADYMEGFINITGRVAHNQYNHNQAPDSDYYIIAASDYD